MIEATGTRAAAAPETASEPGETGSRPAGRPSWTARGLGPALLLMALGLLAVGWSVSVARGGRPGGADTAQILYVAGLVAIFLPAAVGVLLPGTSRSGRIVLAVAMPVLLQLSRLILHPIRFGSSTDDPIHALTGLSPHLGPQVSAALIVLTARLVLALAVVALVEKITWSTRIGAVAGAVYACNPQLPFSGPQFSSQLAYQSIALPLAVLALYLIQVRGRRDRLAPALLALIAAGLVTAGLRLTGARGTPASGTTYWPYWEQALVLGSLVITASVLVPGLFAARRRLSGGRSGVAAGLCLAALAYPVIATGQLATSTARVVDQVAGFSFLGVAFVVGCWLCRHHVRAWHAVAFGIAATLTFLGGVVLGAGSVLRQLPGPAAAPASAGSTDPAELAANAWVAAHLPVAQRLYADRLSHPVDWRLSQDAGIRYVIADRRDAADAVRTLDGVPGVDRIYDNGTIAVYDVGALDATR